MPVVTRFAPSPSGYLHLGHAFSALLNAELARKSSGVFRLRIEDIDAGRCRPAFEEAIFEDLSWLGIRAEGEVLRQSERMPLYREALDRLVARGLLYRCFRTRSQLRDLLRAPHGPEEPAPELGPHPPEEEAERLGAGEPFAWRLSVSEAARRLGGSRLAAEVHDDERSEERVFDFAREMDPVIARKDTPASYHLACVIDDAAQGVTLVCRGEDLRDALAVQLLLQRLLALPAPRYRHHRLVLGEDGRRLAKRDRAATLRSLRDSGTSAGEVRRQLGF